MPSMLLAGLAASMAFLTGCGEPAQNPVRILAPSIRTEDLLRWIDDAGIDRTSIDWTAVNSAHDKYLNQVLADRIVARERITQLFRPVDLNQEVSPEENFRLTKSALGVNRDFAVQLAAQDAAFLDSLAGKRGMSHSITGYLIARRQLHRTAQLFQIADASTSLTTQFATPITMVFAEWPTDAPRSTAEIIAWTMDSAPRLSIPADRWWEATQSSISALLQVMVPQRGVAQTPETQKEAAERIAAIAAKTRAAGVEYMRALFAVLDKNAPGIPSAARESARLQVIGLLTRIPEFAPTLRALKAAENSTQLTPPVRERARKIQIDWLARHARLVREFAPDPAPQSKAAAAAYNQLLALIPSSDDRAHIERAYKEAPATKREPSAESEDLTFYSDARDYRQWMKFGLVSPAPRRETLQSIAQLAQFDSQQEALFVEDARTDWHELLKVENERISAAQKRTQHDENELENPAMIQMLLNECVILPNQHARELDQRIADNLTNQAAVLGGRAEPATTLWRVLRRYPAQDFSAAMKGDFKDLRCFNSVASASIALLAIDRALSTVTRQVLMDLLVAHADELVVAADATNAARNTAFIRIARALWTARRDSERAQTAIAIHEAIRDFQLVNNRWGEIHQSLVDQASTLLSAHEAHALRYRRAQLLYPEIFVGDSTLFARDRMQAIAQASEQLTANDRELALALEVDDLDLVDAIIARLLRTPDAQPSADELKTLYRTDEALAEQSLRRIDRAARAAAHQRP